VEKDAKAANLSTFLKLVAEGEQDEAEKLVKSNPKFALMSGNVTDLANRTFENITAFQYAVWALDWHMWTMIRKYIPTEKAKDQLQGMETSSWVKRHGVSASWQNLIDALQEFIDLVRRKGTQMWRGEESTWAYRVGGAQRLLPAHVVHEYCNPDGSFEPSPDFTKGYLLRTRRTFAGEWYSAQWRGFEEATLGHAFAYARGPASIAHPTGLITRAGAGIAGLDYAIPDYKACNTLLAIRTQQRDQLFAELSTHAQREQVVAPPIPIKSHSPVAPTAPAQIVILNQSQNQKMPEDIKVTADLSLI